MAGICHPGRDLLRIHTAAMDADIMNLVLDPLSHLILNAPLLVLSEHECHHAKGPVCFH